MKKFSVILLGLELVGLVVSTTISIVEAVKGKKMTNEDKRDIARLVAAELKKEEAKEKLA